MRLLLLTIDYPPLPGGISRWTRLLARSLSEEAGHDLHVIAPLPRGADSEGTEEGATVHRGAFFRDVPDRWSPLDLIAYARFSRRLFASVRPEVVIAAQAGIPALVGRRIARGTPLVIAGHGEELARAEQSFWRRAVARGAVRSAALLIANSRSTKTLFVRLGASPARVRRWAAVDPDLCRAATSSRDRPGDEREPPVVLTVGRIDARKGQEQVMRAWPEIRRAVPDAEWWIIGGGPAGEKLRRAAAGFRPPSGIRFLGVVDDRSLRRAYERCSFLLLPSRAIRKQEEGLGLVFLEAAFFAKPSIAGNVGGTADAVVDGKTGILVDAEHPGAIAAAAIRLLRNDSLRRKLGEAARRRIHSRYAFPVAAARVDRWIRRIGEKNR